MVCASTLDYLVYWDNKGFAVQFRGKTILDCLHPVVCVADKSYTVTDYQALNISRERCSLNAYTRAQRRLVLEFSAESLPKLTLTAELECERVLFSAHCEDGASVYWIGLSCWGESPETDTFAVNPKQQAAFLRAAVGPASDRNNTALLDRKTGKLLDFGTDHNVVFSFDYHVGNFRVTSCGNALQLHIIEDFYQKQYGVTYKPITKDSVITGANAGFGTYYPWLFQFDEKDLCEELECMQNQLGDFGINSFIIDLEWVRSDTWGSKNFAGDHFTPDLNRYPSGIAAVAQKIKDTGLVPILWFGISCEARMNEEMLAHPEIILADDDSQWCGRYFLDLTHPYVLDHYLPRFFQQILDWGFEAGKWDLIGETYSILEAHHDKLYNPYLTSPEILRNVMKKAREFFGDRFYLCQCGAPGQTELSFGADIADCCRIGRDLWSWENFREQLLHKLCSHYPLHNVMFYCDPDHTIIADKRITAADTCLFDSSERIESITTSDEAISRLTPVALLGLCTNIGDDLRTLSPERMEMMRHCFPVADVHPQNIGFIQKQEVVPILVQINRPFEKWSVFALINTTDEPIHRSICLQQDLGLEAGDYFLFDYWQNRLVGQYDTIFDIDLHPHQTANYSIHRRSNVPQVLSSSRHMLQGAVELENCQWNSDTNTLTICMQCIRDYPYHISLFVPNSYLCTDPLLVPVHTYEKLGGSVYVFTTDADKTAIKTHKFIFVKE